MPAAPVIFRGQLRHFVVGRTMREASHCVTTLDLPVLPKKNRQGLLREGIVVKPAASDRMPTSFARVIVKQGDPLYLAKTGH